MDQSRTSARAAITHNRHLRYLPFSLSFWGLPKVASYAAERNKCVRSARPELCTASLISPLPEDEIERRESLCELGILDSGADPAFDRLTQLAAQVFGTRFAYVSFVDASHQSLKSELGLGIKETPRKIAFCPYTILSDEVLVVPDGRKDERFRDSPLVTGAPHLRFYAGAPILSTTGHKVGTLCVADTESRRTFTQTDKSILATLATLVSDATEAHRRIRSFA